MARAAGSRNGNFKHGQRSTPTYNTWRSMKERTTNPNSIGYPDYGGRGIRMCDEWHDFVAFYRDMGDRPAGMTLDRIDPDKDYTPSNCRWADGFTQATNKKCHPRYTFGGEELTLGQWSSRVGIERRTINARLRRGWCLTRALLTPLKVNQHG